MTTDTGPVPNFLYIGPDKAGSSWLHEVLIGHPEVHLSEAKDLYFFDRYYDRGIEWYRGQFKKARPEHRVVGEVCQDYLFHPEAAKRIRNDLGPAVRLMVTLREPAARAYSSYLYMLKHGEDVGTFREALDRRPELVEHGRYGDALQRYLEHFPREQIHVALFDDLQRDPQAFMDGVLEWLGVAPMTLDEEQLGARLPASEARSTAVARAVRTVAGWTREHDGAELVGRVKRSLLVQRLLYRPVRSTARTIDPDDAALMWRLLRDDMQLVHELTGVDVLASWTAGGKG